MALELSPANQKAAVTQGWEETAAPADRMRMSKTGEPAHSKKELIEPAQGSSCPLEGFSPHGTTHSQEFHVSWV